MKSLFTTIASLFATATANLHATAWHTSATHQHRRSGPGRPTKRPAAPWVPNIKGTRFSLGVRVYRTTGKPVDA